MSDFLIKISHTRAVLQRLGKDAERRQCVVQTLRLEKSGI